MPEDPDPSADPDPKMVPACTLSISAKAAWEIIFSLASCGFSALIRPYMSYNNTDQLGNIRFLRIHGTGSGSSLSKPSGCGAGGSNLDPGKKYSEVNYIILAILADF